MNNDNNNLMTFRIQCLEGRDSPTELELRRFSIPADKLTIKSLRSAFGESGTLAYVYDGDTISIRTEADLQEYLRLNPSEDNLFRLVCFVNDGIISSVVRGSKHLAEEALVLGVRGKSYVSSKLSSKKEDKEEKKSEETPNSNAPEEPAKAEGEAPEQEAQEKGSPNFLVRAASTAAGVATQAAEEALVKGVQGYSYLENELSSRPQTEDLKPLEQAAQEPPLSASWVNVEQSVPHQQPQQEQQPPQDPLEANLAELATMGFNDAEANRVALANSGNDLEAAIAALLE